MENIILTGMPSSGKSTVGVVLAKTMNKGFVDTDILIQQREGCTLQDIINEKGNDYFHKIEEQVLLDFDGNLYEKTLVLEFHRFLRPERKFESLEELKTEIQKNAAQTRKFFEKI